MKALDVTMEDHREKIRDFVRGGDLDAASAYVDGLKAAARERAAQARLESKHAGEAEALLRHLVRSPTVFGGQS